jgi:hypothetical protein
MYIVNYINPINGTPTTFTFSEEKEARQVFTQLWIDWNRYTRTPIVIDQEAPAPTMHTGEPE